MKNVCTETGKIIFERMEDARIALGYLRYSGKQTTLDGKRIKHRWGKARQRRIYYCSSCKGYHLTSWRWWPFANKKRSISHFTNHELY